MNMFRIAGQVIKAAEPQIKNVSTQSTNPARSVSFGRVYNSDERKWMHPADSRSIAVIEQRRIQSKFDQVLKKSQKHILPKISEHPAKIKGPAGLGPTG